MIYISAYLVIGAIILLPLIDGYDDHRRPEYLVACVVTVVAWPLIIASALALVYTHWND